jgi:plastocyanin
MQLNSRARTIARFAPLAALVLAFAPQTVGAAADAEIKIEIKDHKFSPADIKVPADTAVKLIVTNADASAEEFESHPLGVEKVIAANATATIRIKPLKKGTYAFVGEYHEDTAKGTLTAE